MFTNGKKYAIIQVCIQKPNIRHIALRRCVKKGGTHMTPLTPKEEAIFEYIRDNIRVKGYSPSIRDIRTALDIKSTSTVHTYLERLERKGYIHKENGKSRTLRIEDTIDTAAGTCRGVKVPIVGKVTAGQPILAVENYEGYIHYPEGEGRSHDAPLFALRVQGDSMIEAGILDGDLVIVEKCEYAENGQIVVAMVDDSATVKVFYREDGHYRLQPRNAFLDPIIVNEVVILGRVLASIRYY